MENPMPNTKYTLKLYTKWAFPAGFLLLLLLLIELRKISTIACTCGACLLLHFNFIIHCARSQTQEWNRNKIIKHFHGIISVWQFGKLHVYKFKWNLFGGAQHASNQINMAKCLNRFQWNKPLKSMGKQQRHGRPNERANVKRDYGIWKHNLWFFMNGNGQSMCGTIVHVF